MAVDAPAGIAALGAIDLKGASEITEGPGTFLMEKIKLDKGSELFIDNAAGPGRVAARARTPRTGRTFRPASASGL